MARLLIHVEGQTEEAFANSSLAAHLYDHGYTSVRARLVGNSRNRMKRGGIKDWATVRKDIHNHLKGDGGALATTMVDYYALPKEWPGRVAPPGSSVSQKITHIHQSLREDFEAYTGIANRFRPYVMMHEFEALLFSDCQAFTNSIGFDDEAPRLEAIRQDFETPEHINDSPQTAPSMRLKGVIRGYRKVLFGNRGASAIGIMRIREECFGFNEWLTDLEGWPS